MAASLLPGACRSGPAGGDHRPPGSDAGAPLPWQWVGAAHRPTGAEAPRGRLRTDREAGSFAGIAAACDLGAVSVLGAGCPDRRVAVRAGWRGGAGSRGASLRAAARVPSAVAAAGVR
ncbi:hypothetical protein GCM10023329_50620 [Streptomyces sanyensis]|uniref:Uncharacterized protein n=1 Tax=Streptomyces sanyensis TaxID=568869 RepID=A0ABP9BCA7_9ACTN